MLDFLWQISNVTTAVGIIFYVNYTVIVMLAVLVYRHCLIQTESINEPIRLVQKFPTFMNEYCPVAIALLDVHNDIVQQGGRS